MMKILGNEIVENGCLALWIYKKKKQKKTELYTLREWSISILILEIR